MITPARHHAEWLSLLEISGPFLSMPVLLAAFPQGLDDFPPEEARSLRADYEYWKENANDPATHTAWIRLVLESMLGYTAPVLLSGQAIPGGLKAEFPEHEETLRPDLILVEPGSHQPRLLIQVYPPGQSLEKGLSGSRWSASIATRLMELLHAAEIRLGLATNGEQWLLVDAPRGETTGFTTWYANLWFDEPLTLRALRSLLGLRRFFGVPADETLESLLAKSAQDQQEITDQLGLQVRHAVEILIQSFDRADQDQSRKLLGAGVPPSILYEAALTVMMRLVFMLSAEERKLLPIDDERYAAYYAVSTLREQLQTQADQSGEEVLERRFDAWSRLLAVFRAVYSGIHHQDLHCPPYGGSLFDPDRFPFLEGRVKNPPYPPSKGGQEKIGASSGAQFGNRGVANSCPPFEGGVGGDSSCFPLPINNRTVLHLLDALQMLQVRIPGGTAAEKRRLSFRALDVEQIGHVYEGLLDHIATRANEPVVGLKGTKNQEPEVPLAALEQAAARGEAALLDWLHEQTGRSASALKNALAADLFQSSAGSGHLRSVCGDEALFQRVLPFAGLLREDDLGFPVVILPGCVYVTAGTTRRATGTHYTPRSLTEPIVQHTLEPLVYQGPAEGLPRGEWRLHPPSELLALKVCDMAMGSAGFLVQVVRYLSERLVEAWAEEEKEEEISRKGAKALRREEKEEEKEVSRQAAKAPRREEKEKEEKESSRQAANLPGKNLDSSPLLSSFSSSSSSLSAFAPLREPSSLPLSSSLSAFAPLREQSSSLLLPSSPDDRLVLARRIVAERCIYGVDKNPLAVEIAKLSLWLVTLSKDLPFTFLNHALKCGDSLVGASADDFLRWANRKKSAAMSLDQEVLREELEKARGLRRQIESFVVRDVQDALRKEALLQESEAVLEHVKRGADLITGVKLLGLKPQEAEDLQVRLLDPYLAGELDGKIDAQKYPDAACALDTAKKERIFHWDLEFPEVFEQGGFNAFVGNPPFMGGGKIKDAYGSGYKESLFQLYPDSHGNADLCAYFFLRCFRLLHKSGTSGLIATNTISQGDTRQTGLDTIIHENGCIYRAHNNYVWPGQAAVVVSIVHISKYKAIPPFFLTNKRVDFISGFLDSDYLLGQPSHLYANLHQAFKGHNVYGMGFILDLGETQALIAKSKKNNDVIFPFLNGQDLNSRFDQSSSRYVISFQDWPLDRREKGSWTDADENQRRIWLKRYSVPFDFPGKVASDYPDCLDIVKDRVKPERDKNNRESRSKLWWLFGDYAKGLVSASYGLEKVLVRSSVSNINMWSFVPIHVVCSHALIVVASRSYSYFSLLQSSFHTQWLTFYASSMKTDVRYTPSDCFETFPFPQKITELENIGELYYEHRRQIMLSRQEGLTTTYNRFHNPDEHGADIVRLRELHVEMDQAVAGAYGWEDLALEHGFHQTAQGLRYTISESARREVLARLLKLNHERYEEELKAEKPQDSKEQGARREKVKPSRKNTSKKIPGQESLF